MQNMIRFGLVAMLLGILVLGPIGCGEKEGVGERTGKALDETADDMGKIAEEIEEGAEEVGEAIEEGAEEVKEAVEEAAE